MELRNFADTIVNCTLFCRLKLDSCRFFGNIFYLRSNCQNYIYYRCFQFSLESFIFVFTARCYASAVYAVMWCLSVRLSRLWITSKQINISSKFFHHAVARSFQFYSTKRGAVYDFLFDRHCNNSSILYRFRVI